VETFIHVLLESVCHMEGVSWDPGAMLVCVCVWVCRGGGRCEGGGLGVDCCHGVRKMTSEVPFSVIID